MTPVVWRGLRAVGSDRGAGQFPLVAGWLIGFRGRLTARDATTT